MPNSMTWHHERVLLHFFYLTKVWFNVPTYLVTNLCGSKNRPYVIWRCHGCWQSVCSLALHAHPLTLHTVDCNKDLVEGESENNLEVMQKCEEKRNWGEIQQRENKGEQNITQFAVVRDSGCQSNWGGNPHSCCPANVAFKSYEGIVHTVQGFILEGTFQIHFVVFDVGLCEFLQILEFSVNAWYRWLFLSSKETPVFWLLT